MIKIQYTGQSHRIGVRVIHKPTIVGHQALKNIDFIDHDYWPDTYRYYKQVTEKNIMERYSTNVRQIRQNPDPERFEEEEKEHLKSIGTNIIHKVPLVKDEPLFKIPTVE